LKKIVFTGANGAVGQEFMRQFPETIPVPIRYRNRTQYHNLARAIEKADALIHAGGLLEAEDEHGLIQANALLPADILEIVKRVQSPTFPVALISSMSCLDVNGNYQGASEMSPYAWSKYLMEHMSMRYSGVSVKDCRKTDIYKPDLPRISHGHVFH